MKAKPQHKHGYTPTKVQSSLPTRNLKSLVPSVQPQNEEKSPEQQKRIREANSLEKPWIFDNSEPPPQAPQNQLIQPKLDIPQPGQGFEVNPIQAKLAAQQNSFTTKQRPISIEKSSPLRAKILRQVSEESQQFVAGERLLPGLIQRDEDGTGSLAAQKAEEVYDALNWWNNEAKAIGVLSGCNASLRRNIAREFQSQQGQSLRSYFKEQLGGDWLVKAIAVLDCGHVHNHHTSVALALIPMGTRDDDLMRILTTLPLAGRQTLERKYNDTFYDIGEGSLKADLRGDLSGWREEKSLALLHRNLTSADHLYFDSLAISGTHTDSVVKRIQSEWAKGPGAFASFERDWDQYVRNESGWSSETWTSETLYQAMDGELSGEEWEMVRAVLKGRESYQQEVGVDVGPLSDEQQFQQEEIRLRVAEETLTAATTGGYTGAGTNEGQVFKAVKEIRQIWQDRIARAESAGNEEEKQRYQQRWDTRRQQLMQFIPDEMYTEGADYQRVRLLTAGNLNLADEVYLAGEAYEDEKVISLVTQYWAKGQINELLSQARTPKLDDSGATIRPKFNPLFVIPITRGTDYMRASYLLRRDLSNEARGARRLKLELDEGDSDSDLKKGYDLLKTKGVSNSLRDGVIAQFAAENLGKVAGETPTDKFLNYIDQRYENSTTCYDFRDFLKPTTNPTEMVERAEGRLEASQSGILNGVVMDFVRDYDAITGEDTEQVTLESLERLKFIAEQTGAKPSELEAMLAITGAANQQALAGMEYSAFRSRLEDLRKLKRSITEAIAMTAELVIELALTVVTGGAAGGALIASLSAAVAGMILREAMLGQDYDLVSKKNMQQLITSAAGAGFTSIGKGVFADVINPEGLAKLSRSKTFLQEAATEAFNQVNTQILTTGFEGKFPTVESISAGVFSIAGNSLGAGTKGLITQGLSENASAIEKLRRSVIGNITQQTIAGVGEESGDLVKTGTGNLTGADIALRFGKRSAKAISKGLTTGVGEFGAQQVAAKKQGQGEGAEEETGTRYVEPGSPEYNRPMNGEEPGKSPKTNEESGTRYVEPGSPEYNRLMNGEEPGQLPKTNTEETGTRYVDPDSPEYHQMINGEESGGKKQTMAGVTDGKLPAGKGGSETEEAGTTGTQYIEPGSPGYHRLLHEGWTDQMLQGGMTPTQSPGKAEGEPLKTGTYRSGLNSPDAAYSAYQEALGQAGNKEVGIYRNVETGEYAVRVGTNQTVSAPLEGNWEGVLHYHPNPDNVLNYRMPAPADIEGAAISSLMSEKTITEFVEYPVPGVGTGRVAYIVTYEGEGNVSIAIEYEKADGQRERREYSSLKEYQAAWGERTSYLDPDSNEFEWIKNDLDDFYKNHSQSGGPQTMAGVSSSPKRDKLDSPGNLEKSDPQDADSYYARENFGDTNVHGFPEARYHADAWLEDGGILTMDFRLRRNDLSGDGSYQRSSQLRGREQFEAALNHFGSQVQGIAGNWGDGDNLGGFNRMLQDLEAQGWNRDQAMEQAALFGTKTGQWARGAGFGKVVIDPKDVMTNSQGEVETINVKFVK